jgi:hypothetical protein
MASSSCSTCGIATFLNTEMKQQKERISSQTSFNNIAVLKIKVFFNFAG